MTTAIIAIRPEPGCSATVAAGREAGLVIEAFPLFEVRPIAWQPPAPDQIDDLLLGSANAVRQGGVGLEAFKAKPVYAVGEATAREAEAAGFTVAASGRGDLQSLLDTLSGPLRLLRLAGAEHVPLTPPAGITIEERIVYQSAPRPMPEALVERLRGHALVLLHSAAAARHFGSECDRNAIDRSTIGLAALGPRIADAAGGGWQALRSAPQPSEAALLALAREMCHDLRGV